MTTAMLLEMPNATAWAEKIRRDEEGLGATESMERAVKSRTERLLDTDPDGC